MAIFKSSRCGVKSDMCGDPALAWIFPILPGGDVFSRLRCSLKLLFFFQAEDGIRDHCVTGVQTCALPICNGRKPDPATPREGGNPSGCKPHKQGKSAQERIPPESDGTLRKPRLTTCQQPRSEERRVGKECRSGRWAYD